LILERETSSHLSLSSFIDHYLRLLDFPPDVLDALSSDDINLFEASQLARLLLKDLVLALHEPRKHVQSSFLRIYKPSCQEKDYGSV
jgi:hypothetical protein